MRNNLGLCKPGLETKLAKNRNKHIKQKTNQAEKQNVDQGVNEGKVLVLFHYGNQEESCLALNIHELHSLGNSLLLAPESESTWTSWWDLQSSQSIIFKN